MDLADKLVARPRLGSARHAHMRAVHTAGGGAREGDGRVQRAKRRGCSCQAAVRRHAAVHRKTFMRQKSKECYLTKVNVAVWTEEKVHNEFEEG